MTLALTLSVDKKCFILLTCSLVFLQVNGLNVCAVDARLPDHTYSIIRKAYIIECTVKQNQKAHTLTAMKSQANSKEIHSFSQSYKVLLVSPWCVKHKVFAGSVLELGALVRDRRLCHGFCKYSGFSILYILRSSFITSFQQTHKPKVLDSKLSENFWRVINLLTRLESAREFCVGVLIGHVSTLLSIR